MPVSRQGTVTVNCPHCGHAQAEPRTAVSTFCKKCRGHFHVQELLRPPPRPAEPRRETRRVTCFDCGTELEVPPSAESTMCKRCGRYVDLKDYRITNAVSKNFKTKGAFIVEPKGYVFNTEAVVGEAVIKGRFLGKLIAERSLEIYSTAEIKGGFTTGRLIIPAANHFRWPEPIVVTSAEIAGELVNDLRAAQSVVLKHTGRLFGHIVAAALRVEEGAVFVGSARIGRPANGNTSAA
jgi:cytoskeletal protein CcmA (bactofilin family)/ribosomal protein S27E